MLLAVGVVAFLATPSVCGGWQARRPRPGPPVAPGTAGVPSAASGFCRAPAPRAPPGPARAAIKPNGQIDLAAVLRGIVRNPATLHALVSTGIDFNRALRSLRGCRDFLIGTELIESEPMVSKAA